MGHEGIAFRQLQPQPSRYFCVKVAAGTTAKEHVGDELPLVDGEDNLVSMKAISLDA